MFRILGFCVLLGLGQVAHAQVPTSQAEISLSFAPVVKAAAPAVVNIYAKKQVVGRVSPFAGDPFFDQFFGRSRPRIENSLGSGVILSPDGFIVTNYHVVGEASDIRVVMLDKREFDAQVVLSDEDRDLAILKVDADKDLPFLVVRDRDPEIGDLVLAIGNPFGVGQTVTSGIVSALARDGQMGGYFIQTDAAINPGNSGGALVGMDGDLLGVNTAILTRSGGSNGVGFAIPGQLVMAYLSAAMNGASQVADAWSGLRGQPVDAAMAEALGLSEIDGLLISELHAASPFAGAGLQVGDVILRLQDGPAVDSLAALDYALEIDIDGRAEVVFWRDGSQETAQISFGAAPDTPPAQPVTIEQRSPLEGLTIGRINPAIIDQLDLPLAATGVVVLNARGYARRFGLREGDVILGINGQVIDTPDDVVDRAGDRLRTWQLDILRGGQRTQLRFRI